MLWCIQLWLHVRYKWRHIPCCGHIGADTDSLLSPAGWQSRTEMSGLRHFHGQIFQASESIWPSFRVDFENYTWY